MAQPFAINIPQAKLDAIAARVRGYPWFPAPDGEAWEYGVNTAYFKEFCAYWLERFDWRAAERELNKFPQFTANIDGLDVHFVHVRGEGDAAKRPLILTHGWPGSHYEFWGSIEKLAFPSKHGGDAKDAFDVIVPSLPGYGFSGKPKKPFGQGATARLWNKLMTEELGYKTYVAQGGDWGSLVTMLLGYNHAPACVGVHVNMMALQLGGGAAPQTDEERNWAAAAARSMQAETAYFQEQTTKPQTLAMSLMDSPVGTAAWILEKFHGWSDIRKSGLEGVYTKDQLLTNIMIYLVTDSIATSVWYYRARADEQLNLGGAKLQAPLGVSNFKGEGVFQMAPRSMIERIHKIAFWSDQEEGGHFAAMEQPDAFVADVRAFARAIGY